MTRAEFWQKLISNFDFSRLFSKSFRKLCWNSTSLYMYHIVWKDRKKVIMFLDTNLPLWKLTVSSNFFLNFVRRLFTMTLSKMASSFFLAQTNKSFLYSVVWIIENIYQRIKISCKIVETGLLLEVENRKTSVNIVWCSLYLHTVGI